MSLLLNTIEAFPRGRTTRELFALLDVDFNHASQLHIQGELNTLQQEGTIFLDRDRKWRSIIRQAAVSLPTDRPQKAMVSRAESKVMLACAATFSVETATTVQDSDKLDKTHPDCNALLRYYRSALQSDPRGSLTQADDRHGTTFQFLCGRGVFFPQENEQGIIRIRLNSLPDCFREAILRREANENAFAIGWPISIGRYQGAPAIQPVGLLAATWERSADHLVVSVPANDILINPDWIKSAARGSAWSEVNLRNVFQEAGGCGLPYEEFLNRLREASAKSIRGKLTGRSFVPSLDPADEGIFDAVGIFLPSGNSFTAGSARDLDAIAAWSVEKLARTALAPLLGLPVETRAQATDPINVGPLNHEQIQAVANAMSETLSVVTGPPGTGKSQAIVAMVATAMLRGENVIVASKNHQALDAVQARLHEIAPDAPFSVRTLDPTNNVDESVVSVLEDIVRNPTGSGARPETESVQKLWQLAKDRGQTLNLIEQRRALNLRLATNIEKAELRRDAGLTDETATVIPIRQGLWRRIWLWLTGRQTSIADTAESNSLTLAEIDSQIATDRRALVDLGTSGDPVDMTQQIQTIAQKVLRQHLALRTAPDPELRTKLSNANDDLALAGNQNLSRDITQVVLDHRPLWLASVLGTPKRVPLFDGLFDLVVFDEASQCDIASALPLFARAKRAVVVGDDRQLAFISQIGAAQDRNLMAAQGLPSTGMGRYAQGRKSLFDFANSTPDVAAVMLRDQYRSAEDIVDYINRNFYQGKLRVSADVNSFKVPDGARTGLTWSDVPGQSSPQAGIPNVNPAELKAITAHLKTLLVDQDYSGSVGVISPFRAQVAALQSALSEALPEAVWDRASLKVATVDGFQGQERDLILFSPVVHANSAMSAKTFLQRDWRRLNVAVSRARAVAHIFGDLAYARAGSIQSLSRLAAPATEPKFERGEAIFDSQWERITFHALRKRGLDPTPQYDIAGRRLDFALFGKNGTKLDLEVDGRIWHQDIDGNRKLDDHWRDHQMKSLGWKVRRFWVDELKTDMERCIDLIEQDLG